MGLIPRSVIPPAVGFLGFLLVAVLIAFKDIHLNKNLMLALTFGTAIVEFIFAIVYLERDPISRERDL
jgi:hypothetical protein